MSKWNVATGIESWKVKELMSYCDRAGYDIDLFIKINDILKSNGFDNWHQREHHAIPEILDAIYAL